MNRSPGLGTDCEGKMMWRYARGGYLTILYNFEKKIQEGKKSKVFSQ